MRVVPEREESRQAAAMRTPSRGVVEAGSARKENVVDVRERGRRNVAVLVYVGLGLVVAALAWAAMTL